MFLIQFNRIKGSNKNNSWIAKLTLIYLCVSLWQIITRLSFIFHESLHSLINLKIILPIPQHTIPDLPDHLSSHLEDKMNTLMDPTQSHECHSRSRKTIIGHSSLTSYLGDKSLLQGRKIDKWIKKKINIHAMTKRQEQQKPFVKSFTAKHVHSSCSCLLVFYCAAGDDILAQFLHSLSLPFSEIGKLRSALD